MRLAIVASYHSVEAVERSNYSGGSSAALSYSFFFASIIVLIYAGPVANWLELSSMQGSHGKITYDTYRQFPMCSDIHTRKSSPVNDSCLRTCTIQF